jgi:hypothetical protein
MVDLTSPSQISVSLFLVLFLNSVLVLAKATHCIIRLLDDGGITMADGIFGMR